MAFLIVCFFTLPPFMAGLAFYSLIGYLFFWPYFYLVTLIRVKKYEFDHKKLADILDISYCRPGYVEAADEWYKAFFKDLQENWPTIL